MDRATLADITGAGEVRIRQRSEHEREYRGVFAFRKAAESTLVALLASREVVEYVGMIDGAVKRLGVRVTDISLENGLASFQGVGEPYDEAQGTWAG